MEKLPANFQLLPNEKIPFDVYSLAFVQSYHASGAHNKANQMSDYIASYYENYLEYYSSLDAKRARFVESDFQQAIAILQRLGQIANAYQQTEQVKKISTILSKYIKE